MVKLQISNLPLRVRFSHPAPNSMVSLVQWSAHLAVTEVVRVQSSYDTPIMHRQLSGRAMPLQGGGRRFNPVTMYQVYADIAQVVEQRIENPCVPSSTLGIGTKFQDSFSNIKCNESLVSLVQIQPPPKYGLIVLHVHRPDQVMGHPVQSVLWRSSSVSRAE